MGQAGAAAQGAAEHSQPCSALPGVLWQGSGALPESLAQPGQSSALSQPAQQQEQPKDAAAAPGFGEGMSRGQPDKLCSGCKRGSMMWCFRGKDRQLSHPLSSSCAESIQPWAYSCSSSAESVFYEQKLEF